MERVSKGLYYVFFCCLNPSLVVFGFLFCKLKEPKLSSVNGDFFRVYGVKVYHDVNGIMPILFPRRSCASMDFATSGSMLLVPQTTPTTFQLCKSFLTSKSFKNSTLYFLFGKLICFKEFYIYYIGVAVDRGGIRETPKEPTPVPFYNSHKVQL